MIANKAVLVLSAVSLIAGSILATPASAASGKGWDVFNIGAGEKIPAPSEKIPSVLAGAGKGWDVFQVAYGEPLRSMPSYVGTSNHQVHGAGWDVFKVGEGEGL